MASSTRGRFRKRNLKHAKECSIQQRRGFACGVCRWKRRFGCSRNSAVSAARFESGFRERDGQGQHWRGPHSHGGFLKMIVCESGGHANGLTYFIFRFLRRPQGQFLPLLPMATMAKNAHENGHILFRFFGVFLPLRTTFAQQRCSEYPLESFMTVLEACSRPN